MGVLPLRISMKRSKTVDFERVIILFLKLVHHINYGTVQNFLKTPFFSIQLRTFIIKTHEDRLTENYAF